MEANMYIINKEDNKTNGEDEIKVDEILKVKNKNKRTDISLKDLRNRGKGREDHIKTTQLDYELNKIEDILSLSHILRETKEKSLQEMAEENSDLIKSGDAGEIASTEIAETEECIVEAVDKPIKIETWDEYKPYEINMINDYHYRAKAYYFDRRARRVRYAAKISPITLILGSIILFVYQGIINPTSTSQSTAVTILKVIAMVITFGVNIKARIMLKESEKGFIKKGYYKLVSGTGNIVGKLNRNYIENTVDKALSEAKKIFYISEAVLFTEVILLFLIYAFLV